MMYVRFAEELKKTLRNDMNNYTDDLANGVCKTFDEYQHLCGVIKGLAFAERHILDLVKHLETDANE
tara:strand:+ start:1870 stop:2070 length:201 start_codon:yes stop_codon:yes gene_type:complete